MCAKQVIPITIPRVFYVNCLEDKGPAGSSTMGRRVARTLPNGRASPFLYEVAMDEAKFQRNEKQVCACDLGVPWVTKITAPLFRFFWIPSTSPILA